MQEVERRRDVRIHVSPPGEIVRVAGREPLQILNASYRGIFARVEGTPPQLGEVLKLAITIPTGRVEVHAVPVRVIKDPMGRFGIGFRFFALNGEYRRLWESFITGLIGTRRAAA